MYRQEDIKALAEACEDPVWFAENFLGVETWSRQREMLRAVRDNQSVAIRSGHKTSKSFSYMILALWWVVLWHLKGEDARVALSAASFNQVKDIVWREIRHRYRVCKPLQQLCEKPPSLDPATGLTLTSGNQIFGFSTTEAENAAGISSPHNLFLLDEASGIEDKVFEALEGNMAGGAKMVMSSQATKMTGNFYNAFNKYKSFWYTMKISSWDSPNVTGEKEIPGLATKEWCEQKRQQWGEDSPLYAVRVLGEFPGSDEYSVIDSGTIEQAMERWEDTPEVGRLRIGADIARGGGDKTVIFAVRGMKVYPAVVMYDADGADVAAKICDVAKKYRRANDHEIDVKLDEIGLGSSPIDFLNKMEMARILGLRIKPIHVQGKAHDNDNYANIGAEMAFFLADWLKGGGALPRDDYLHEELVATTYAPDNQGRRKLEASKNIKKLLKRSPDRRMALEMAVYDPKARVSVGAGHVTIM